TNDNYSQCPDGETGRRNGLKNGSTVFVLSVSSLQITSTLAGCYETVSVDCQVQVAAALYVAVRDSVFHVPGDRFGVARGLALSLQQLHALLIRAVNQNGDLSSHAEGAY